MDLTQYKAVEEGQWLELEDPVSGEPVGAKIKVLGADSDVYKKTQHKQQDRHLKKGLQKLKSEQVEADITELLVACTQEWEGVEESGQTLDCTKENIRHVYKTYDFVREQVRDFVEDRANFLGEY